MAQMDAFSAQIVKFVREMPDDALLDLVKQKLGILGMSAARNGRGTLQVVSLPLPVAGAKSKGKRGVATLQPPSSRLRRAAPTSAARQSMLDSVERIVKASSGVSASDVARLAGILQTRAAAALKELKVTKRIFQGGDRRFARYAGDLKTAERASATARKTAKGPIVSSSKNGERPRKRAPALAAAAPAA